MGRAGLPLHSDDREPQGVMRKITQFFQVSSVAIKPGLVISVTGLLV